MRTPTTQADADPEKLRELIARIISIGKLYTPALLPEDIPRGEVGYCFDYTALRVMQLRPKYRYVEGIVQYLGEWSLHAWLTDAEGVNAYDLTWRAFGDRGEDIPFPGKYVGIEIGMDELVAFMKKTRHQGVFPNGWRSPSLFERCVPEFGDPIKL